MSSCGAVVAATHGDVFHDALGNVLLEEGAGGGLLISTERHELAHGDALVPILGEIFVECHVERLGIGGFEAAIVNLEGNALQLLQQQCTGLEADAAHLDVGRAQACAWLLELLGAYVEGQYAQFAQLHTLTIGQGLSDEDLEHLPCCHHIGLGHRAVTAETITQRENQESSLRAHATALPNEEA